MSPCFAFHASVQARAFFTCPEAPRRTRAWCLATPGCSFVPQPNPDGLRACEATFYANMTPAQRLDFGGAGYWVRMPREILGCCKVSRGAGPSAAHRRWLPLTCFFAP